MQTARHVPLGTGAQMWEQLWSVTPESTPLGRVLIAQCARQVEFLEAFLQHQLRLTLEREVIDSSRSMQPQIAERAHTLLEKEAALETVRFRTGDAQRVKISELLLAVQDQYVKMRPDVDPSDRYASDLTPSEQDMVYAVLAEGAAEKQVCLCIEDFHTLVTSHEDVARLQQERAELMQEMGVEAQDSRAGRVKLFAGFNGVTGEPIPLDASSKAVLAEVARHLTDREISIEGQNTAMGPAIMCAKYVAYFNGKLKEREGETLPSYVSLPVVVFIKKMVNHLIKRHSDYFSTEDRDVIAYGVERFICPQIVTKAYDKCLSRGRDAEFARVCREYRHVTQADVQIEKDIRSPEPSIVQPYGDAIACFKTLYFAICPQDKLWVINQAKEAIYAEANRNCATSTVGADDLIPIYIYVLLKSNVPCMMSTLDYIQEYLPSTLSCGEASYYYLTTRQVCEYIGSALTLDIQKQRQDRMNHSVFLQSYLFPEVSRILSMSSQPSEPLSPLKPFVLVDSDVEVPGYTLKATLPLLSQSHRLQRVCVVPSSDPNVSIHCCRVRISPALPSMTVEALLSLLTRERATEGERESVDGMVQHDKWVHSVDVDVAARSLGGEAESTVSASLLVTDPALLLDDHPEWKALTMDVGGSFESVERDLHMLSLYRWFGTVPTLDTLSLTVSKDSVGDHPLLADMFTDTDTASTLDVAKRVFRHAYGFDVEGYVPRVARMPLFADTGALDGASAHPVSSAPNEMFVLGLKGDVDEVTDFFLSLSLNLSTYVYT
ncbi:hypothetical protein KIPB_002220 [Kipferlia bialata]|uniref:VPS9 domain-containing protein n=1 Tax=Kipferlia bialata TaxID=797122 RepID=A0A9K3GES9_9EUKA|nr:hypothetical protein KIPB_002220 [Kipferlia bialata]|eukprot:g2220.t1